VRLNDKNHSREELPKMIVSLSRSSLLLELNGRAGLHLFVSKASPWEPLACTHRPTPGQCWIRLGVIEMAAAW
jgi:hypothetical protein